VAAGVTGRRVRAGLSGHGPRRSAIDHRPFGTLPCGTHHPPSTGENQCPE
jgi:hypothetical protein